MATASVNLAAASGFAFVTLTSWAGDAVFPSQPVIDSQIYAVDTLTVGVDGQVSGANGNYTLVKVALSGDAEAITYNITNAVVPQGTVTISNIDVTTTTGTVTFSYNDTDQTGFEYRIDGGSWTAATSPQEVTGLTSGVQYAVDVRAVNAVGGGTAASDTFTTTSTSGTSAVAPFTAGATYTTVTLGASPGQTHFGSFAVAPVVNDQITTLTTDGTFDAAGAFTQSNGGNYTVYHTRYATGIVSTETVSIGSLTVTDTSPAPGDTVVFTFGGKVGPFTATYNGQSLTIASQTATSVTITWPEIQSLGNQLADYNTAYDCVITDTDDASTLTQSMTTVPATAHDYHVITGSPWTTDSIYDDDTGLADGHKHYGYLTTGSGTVATDGVVTSVTDRASYDYWIWDGTEWGNSGTELFHILGPFLTTTLELVPSSETSSSVQLRFQADLAGDYRIVGVSTTDSPPTISQVLAGQNSAGTVALSVSGLTAFSADTLTTETMTGINSGATLSFYIALEDAQGRQRFAGPVNATTTQAGGVPSWTSSIPENTYSDGIAITPLELSLYSSGATSYDLSGLPGGTGITLNPITGAITGAPTLADASGADGTTVTKPLIATAINSSGSSSAEFDMSFYNRNPPVVATSIPDQTWSEALSIPLNVSSYITGATSFELQIYTQSAYSDATAKIATYNVTFNTSTGAFGGVPNNIATTDSPLLFRVRGANADGNSDWELFSSTVNDITAAGVISPVGTRNLTEGTYFSSDLSSNFINANSYTITGLPSGTGISINSDTGVLSGTPTASDSSASPIYAVVTAVNSNGNATSTLTANVTALSPPILVTSFPDLSAEVTDTITIIPGDYFTGEDSITVSGLPTGSGLTFDGTTLTGDLNAVDRSNTPLDITVTATNTEGSRIATFRISVTGSILVSGSFTTPSIRTIPIGTRRTLSPKVFTQDTIDRLDYAVDLSTWLGSDTILSVITTEGDSVIDTGTYSSTAFRVFVTGGTQSEATRITAHVTTTEGREIDVSFYVAFVDM